MNSDLFFVNNMLVCHELPSILVIHKVNWFPINSFDTQREPAFRIRYQFQYKITNTEGYSINLTGVLLIECLLYFLFQDKTLSFIAVIYPVSFLSALRKNSSPLVGIYLSTIEKRGRKKQSPSEPSDTLSR